MTFGVRLKKMRIEQGMTQLSLAEAMIKEEDGDYEYDIWDIDAAVKRIYRWENDKYKPRFGDVIILHRVLRCDYSDLFGE